ncbi:MAG: purine-nucleoside phosphorylase [Acidobacteriaceae bacterium]
MVSSTEVVSEMDAYAQASAAAAYIRAQADVQPRIGLVLGSGLGSGLGALVDTLFDAVAHPFAEIPHFPRTTVAGHTGRLVLGSVNGVVVAIMQGRVHGYEGYTPAEVVFPVRVLRLLGVSTMVITNAAGGIRTDLRPGDLVLLTDHINFTGSHPLTGVNEVRFGPRFCDMTDAYVPRLRALAYRAAAEEDIPLAEGVYLGLSGPSYETPAEIRAFRTLGADVVGMSTVHEVIAARHLGMEVAGISCVTNMAAGVAPGVIDHQEVLETGSRVADRLGRLLARLIPLLAGAA